MSHGIVVALEHARNVSGRMPNYVLDRITMVLQYNDFPRRQKPVGCHDFQRVQKLFLHPITCCKREVADSVLVYLG